MEIFGSVATVSFYILMLVILGCAVLTVTVGSLFRAAIFLAFTLIGVSLIFFFLHAEFIAAVQLLLYVGAVLTLVIFAVMLTARIGDPSVEQTNRQRYPALIVLVLIAVALVGALLKTPWNLAATPQSTDAVQIGKALMGTYVFPFEVISLVLLVALIGAIVVARSDR